MSTAPAQDPSSEGAYGPSAPGGLLDVLKVAAVVLDDRGRIVLWSPQAEALFGYTAEEALGKYAARVLVHEEHRDEVVELFAHVMREGLSWAGVFPVRHKDGSTRLLEFRNMRLRGQSGNLYALGLAAEQSTLRGLERDVALSTRLVAQSPIGVAVLDPSLRFLSVNPALARLSGLPADAQTGRPLREALWFLDVELVESAARRVLRSGAPLVDQNVVGRPAADPDEDHAWSVSYHRLEAGDGRVLGLALSVVDVTDRHRVAIRATHARRRLAMIADASVRVGTTLDVTRTAHELAGLVVPELADEAAVDLLDTALRPGGSPDARTGGPPLLRCLAEVRAPGSQAAPAAGAPPEGAPGGAGRGGGAPGAEDGAGPADVPGVAAYEPGMGSAVARCVERGEPVLLARVGPGDLAGIARDAREAERLGRAGLHSYLVVPLVARGAVLGALRLRRTRRRVPFDHDDLVLARELAGRAAVAVDHACWYRKEHDTALTLQRSLLPRRPPPRPGLEIAYRYQPAGAADEVGGDWFDVIPLSGRRTALVVGDVMGSGVAAAATMGQLRTTTRALAGLDLDPAELLHHVDRSTTGLEQATATCVYAVYDPDRRECRIANAGHLPPVRVPSGGAPELLDLPTGVPLGVGSVPFHTRAVALRPGDRLVLYTDGLVEVRDAPIDSRLEQLLTLLADSGSLSLDRSCDEVLGALRDDRGHDDVALLIACGVDAG
ncbi:PAS sensor protein [Streptomyces sp. CC53]|uniref:SpoIIE family protein phosphatase n=1 Tax=unclassified Streptomyces TaxID=2593676 RepID=UPI0008DCD20B|nr:MULTISPECIES: SpoIIE family protein phosphatase [unclassified Streptomyces]OII66197.1 PAS sensor protein [Streptomyces sp. CC53]